MYGIFTCIWSISMVNVGVYTIHLSLGIQFTNKYLLSTQTIHYYDRYFMQRSRPNSLENSGLGNMETMTQIQIHTVDGSEILLTS